MAGLAILAITGGLQLRAELWPKRLSLQRLFEAFWQGLDGFGAGRTGVNVGEPPVSDLCLKRFGRGLRALVRAENIGKDLRSESGVMADET